MDFAKIRNTAAGTWELHRDKPLSERVAIKDSPLFDIMLHRMQFKPVRNTTYEAATRDDPTRTIGDSSEPQRAVDLDIAAVNVVVFDEVFHSVGNLIGVTDTAGRDHRRQLCQRLRLHGTHHFRADESG